MKFGKQLEKIGSAATPSEKYTLAELYRRTGQTKKSTPLFSSIDESKLSERDRQSLRYFRKYLK